MSAKHFAVAAVLALCSIACGSKTQLRTWDASPPPPECMSDTDCDDGQYCNGVEACREGRCIPGAPVICAHTDECYADTCNEARRACDHTRLTQDMDGDGYYGPRPGYGFGTPGSCGDDCNDMNASIHPGATEVCNGIDDNCNHLIDEGAMYTAPGPDIAVSEPMTAPSQNGGIAWSGRQYMATYSGYTEHTAHVYFSALDQAGARISTPPQLRETETPSDAFGAAVAWTGSVLGIAWQDRRDGDYEIYFNLLSPDGAKLGPDQRVTFARGFSINPTMVWTGQEFLLAWQDERDAVGTGRYAIYAQRIDGQGRQIADNQRMVQDRANSEAPSIAFGTRGVGLTWIDGRDGPIDAPALHRAVYFAPFAADLRRLSPDQRVTDPAMIAISPTLVWNVDRWVVAWFDGAIDSPDHEIWGATLDAMGHPIVAPRRISNDPNYSRYPALQPMGDRIFVLWADDRDGSGYEIYSRIVDPSLMPLTAETRVTFAPRDSVYPTPALGPSGDLGILFSDQRGGPWHVRFTRLQCAIPH